MSRFRLVSPAGAPLPVRSVLPAVFPTSGERPALAELVGARLGVQNPFFISSGRAALTILLRALQQGSDRREVVIPAYTCFSVPSAVARAGLTIRLCDVDPTTLDLDLRALERLDLGRALCIIPSGLYGLPGDLIAQEQIARTYGAFLIDDAAQCLGATQGGRVCGSFGDAGFYSLGRGKGITTMGGGILVTSRWDLAEKLAAIVRGLRPPSVWTVGGAVASSLAYAAMLRPSRYWLVDQVPFLELGASRFEPDFEIAPLSAYQTRLATRMFSRLDSYNEIRREHADQLCSGLEGLEDVEIPRPVDGATPVYVRFPILTRDGSHRARLLGRLRQVGIGAHPSYPTSIADIPGIGVHLAQDQEACPAARAIAARVLTLPTHPGVTPHDVELMVNAIRGNRRESEAAR